MNKIKATLLILITATIFVTACNNKQPERVYTEPTTNETVSSSNVIDESVETAKKIAEPVVEEVKDSTYIQKAKSWLISKYNRFMEKASEDEGTLYEPTEWTVEDYPEYYKVIGSAYIDKTEFPKPGLENVIYNGLDEKGRTLSVLATINHEMVKSRVGHEVSWPANSEPSGWFSSNGTSWNVQNGEQYIELSNGKSYSGHFYNRSHLLADSLGGSANRENLITGTRTQNVGINNQKTGMQYLEFKVRSYLLTNKEGIVYYKVEPVYVAEEIVPRSVIVTAQSEDLYVNEKVEVFNTANGYTIDYNTGGFYK